MQDAMTSTRSHELCEAITDALAGQGWSDDANGEIGDICASKAKKLGAYTLQTRMIQQSQQVPPSGSVRFCTTLGGRETAEPFRTSVS